MQETRTLEELAHRESDGIEVSLVWSPADNRVEVAVVDGRTGARFEISIRAESALDAFYHPFAYASFGLVPCRTTRAQAA